ncbi:MAG: N-6 DNA methylase [Candidatus Marinimicrobia bacterium]|nr:N-6 DNA methylase [Candidatus Neomarinimicrobiota bacterium]
MLNEYLKNLTEVTKHGDGREESYYSALEKLLYNFSESQLKRKIHVTTLPKKTDAGNPDFRIWDGRMHVTGYIEAKAPTTQNLSAIAATEQLQRYISTFPNVILTNFLEFRLYRQGELIDTCTIAHSNILLQVKTTPPVLKESAFIELLTHYFDFRTPAIRSASRLATELAKRTRFLRDQVVALEMAEEGRKGKKELLGFYEAFKTYLIGTLTEKQFADLYAQTITYGLFAAKTRAGQEFNRKLAFEYIPNTIGILRDVFRFISLETPPRSLEVIVDDIAEVLQATDTRKILREYYQKGKGSDPIIHFYETFLAKYDPGIRERRGVYYTPEPVVNYIVKSLHQLLKDKFNKPDGFASEGVTVLDPAGGTLTFPVAAIKIAVQEHENKWGGGDKTSFIRNQILPNFYAFELMMAPYAIGHLKMGFMLEELGYSLADDERFKLYLTNTLVMEEIDQVAIPGLSSLSEESLAAGKVKKEDPVLVIFGNPPYSGHSANINDWTEKLLKTDIDGAASYYQLDGKPLGERNPKLLQDDYVKFLRFAQWKISKAGRGIVGMITNHGYLENPTFRGMRQSLLKTFDEIYILDLHGNSLKKETCPDGSKDENVFDIRQGVAIALFIKNNPDILNSEAYSSSPPPQKEKLIIKIFHKDLWGLRNNKYDWLSSKQIKIDDYEKFTTKHPWFFFLPRKTASIEYYLDWCLITTIFPVNSSGVKTHRDAFVIGFNKNEIQIRIQQLKDANLPDEIILQTYNLKNTSSWNLENARELIQKDENWNNYFKIILFRPFDDREIYFSSTLVDRPRYEIMRHMLEENLSLCFMRQFSGNLPYTHALISEHMVDNRTFFSSKGIIQQAPLYIYPEKADNYKSNSNGTEQLFSAEEPTGRKPNISKAVFDALAASYGTRPAPGKILFYIYAVMYSTTYREKYSEFLRIDFPRIPFTKDRDLFKRMAKLGQQLTYLHLLKSVELNNPIAKFEGSGDNDRVEKPIYDKSTNRVYINADKYFTGVKPQVWEYQVGGYQVLSKYLKDRKGRLMDDPRHYCRVVTALEKTIDLQQQIDTLYPKVEKNILLIDK